MKKILGIITARGGSKGIPGKNIKFLGGKPLILYTLEAGKKSKLITHLITSTDDSEIIEVVRERDGEVPFIRPAELARDTTLHVPVIQHGVKFMEDKLGIIFDYVVILQPTSPFRTPDDIDQTINKLVETGADSAVSIVPINTAEHPIKIKKFEGDFVKPYCIEEVEGTRRQDLPEAYKRSGTVYAMKRDLIMKDNKLYGEKIAGHIVPKERSIDIDYPLDWIIAEYMLEDLKKKGYEF